MTSATDVLPRWASDILGAMPHRGGGLHTWFLKAAIALRRCGRADREITQTLRAATAGEPVKANEIEDAVKRSIDCMTDDSNAPACHSSSSPAWPKIDTILRSQAIAKTDITVGDLWEASPVHFDDDYPQTDSILAVLFPENPLLSVACKWESAVTRHLSQFKNLCWFQFLVPSPMSAPIGITKDGKESARCLDNTGPRRYLIVEQDSGEPDEQASIIAHLSDFAPLVLVVHSGGKSLHAWFVCGDQEEGTIRRFFNYAVRLGADRATWTPCQLVRLPDGTRRVNGKGFKRQFVLFWNPEAARC